MLEGFPSLSHPHNRTLSHHVAEGFTAPLVKLANQVIYIEAGKMPASISSSVTVVGLLLTSVSAGVALNARCATSAVDSYGASLLGVVGVLTFINIIALGIWMSDNPAAARAMCARQNLGVLGVVMASSAVTVVSACTVDPVLYFGLLGLLLVGISLVMHGALGLGA